jgi:hypothetical protein
VLNAHFDYLMDRHLEIEYSPDRLAHHRALAREYFQIKSDAARVNPTAPSAPEQTA